MRSSEHDRDMDEKQYNADIHPATTYSSTSEHDNEEKLTTHEDHEEADPETQRPRLSRTASRRSATSTKSAVATALDRVLTTKSIQDPGPPPDGGLKAWTQTACAFGIIAVSWGWINSYGSFQVYYTLNLPESPSTISWIGTVQTFLTFSVSALSGRMLDAGFFVPTYIVGATIQVLGIFLMSISTKYWQLMLTNGVLCGLGAGIYFAPTMGLVATYFSKKRALALGIVTCGNSIGGIIFPVMARQLLPKIGFAWTARVLGFFNLAILSFALCFIRPRLPPRKSGPIIDFKAFREAPYCTLVAGLFFDIWSIYYTFYFIGSFGVNVTGMSFQESTNLIILINGVGLPARVIPPYFADKMGQLNLMLPTVASLALVGLCWLAVKDVAGVYVFAIFYGIASGSFQCLIPSTVAKLTPDLNMVGTRLGMAFSMVGFAALISSPIGGAIQSAQHGSYTGANLLSGLTTCLAFLLILVTRYTLVGWKVKVKV